MSVLVLALLAAAGVSARFVESQKQGAAAHLKDLIEGKRLDELVKIAERNEEASRRSMLQLKIILDGHKEAIEKNLYLSEREKEEISRSLENFTRNVDEVQPRGDSIEEINRKSGVANELFQGDIILSEEQKEQLVAELDQIRPKRQAQNDKSYPGHRWSDGVLYYFDVELSRDARTAFKKAAQLWMDDTCIDFHEIRGNNEASDYAERGWEEDDGERTATGEENEQHGEENILDYEQQMEGGGMEYEEGLPEHFIYVFMKQGCSSRIGRQQGVPLQFLSLGQGCETVGTAAHEIGHALGFWHTHSRHDRNQFITVDKGNIHEGYRDEFMRQSKKTNYNYNLTYDYGSVMHYGATSGSINKKPTMVPKDIMYMETMGSETISFYDLLMMNMYYNCTDLCKGENTPCQNGGFAHPRDCTKCICPSGYGGQFCDERPPGCGEELEATMEWSLLENKLDGRKANEERDGFKRCNYWIKAPAGQKVEVKLVKLPKNVTVDGCIYAGVEIKTHPDQRLTGYRFCSQDDVNTVLTSTSNIVPVITYNRVNRTTIRLEYRYV